MRFSGAVLTGGASSRMGTDKAFVEVNGRALVDVARRALLDAGADELYAIGGDADRLGQMGFVTHADSEPGAGPLGGLIDALRVSRTQAVVVLACDQPNVDGQLVRHLIEALGGADAAVPVVNGSPQPLVAVYASRARSVLEEAFLAGERSPRRVLGLLKWRALTDIDPASVQDVDDPMDVARYASDDRPPRSDMG